MKTKGLTFAQGKKVLCALVLLASVPVYAQVSFAAQKSISFNNVHQRFAASFLSFYITADPETQENSKPLPSFRIKTIKNNTVDEDVAITHRIETANNSSAVENNDLRGTNLKINFIPVAFTYPESCGLDMGIADYSKTQLMLYAKSLKEYAIKNDFDSNYAFFSNMAMRYDKKRFFVVNLTTMEIQESGLVAQGRGQGRSRFDKQYSNKPGSKCTSLGRYKIMGDYNGGYGKSYRLDGLDSSNNNAYNRNVVLHSMGCIPDSENNVPVCISEGCPAVSVNFFSSLSSIIESRKKPMLLWIFDSNLEKIVVEPLPNRIIETGDMAAESYHTCSLHFHNSPELK
jgi:hypothetical protein